MPLSWVLLATLLFNGVTHAHDHQAHITPPGQYTSLDAIDVILWLHIIIQIVVWMVIFPVGMILGTTRSCYHVPIQFLGIILSLTAHFLGHSHGGRTFRSSPHSSFAPLLETWLITQTFCGIYLKLHLKHKFSVPVRSFILTVHAILGFGIPVASWAQVVLGGFTALGFCRGARAGECVIRTGVGSAVVAIGISLLVITLLNHDTVSFSVVERARMGLITGSGMCILIADWLYRDTTNSQVHMEIVGMGFIWMMAFGVLVGQERASSGDKFACKCIPGLLLFINGWYITADQADNAPRVLYNALSFTLQAAGFSDIVLALSAYSQSTPKFSTTPSAPYSSSKTPLKHFLSLTTSYFLLTAGFLFISTNAEQIHLLSAFKIAPALLILVLHGASSPCFGSILLLMRLWNRSYVKRKDEYVNGGGVISSEEDARRGGIFQTVPLPNADTFDLGDTLDSA